MSYNPFGAGKGDTPRPVDQVAFSSNFDNAFGTRPVKQRHVKCKTCHGAGTIVNESAMYGAPKRLKCPAPGCDGGLVPEAPTSD